MRDGTPHRSPTTPAAAFPPPPPPPPPGPPAEPPFPSPSHPAPPHCRTAETAAATLHHSATPALAVYADGGTLRGGRGAYWTVALEGPAGVQVVARRTDARLGTSMEAESAALAEALRHVCTLPAQRVTFFTDCQGLARSLARRRPLRAPAPRTRRLAALQQEILCLWGMLTAAGHQLSVRWLPRERMEAVLGH